MRTAGILVIIALTLLVLGCVKETEPTSKPTQTTVSKPQSTSTTLKATTSKTQERRLTNLALSEDDVKYCLKIKDDDEKYNCITELAVNRGDQRTCLRIKDNKKRQVKCRREVISSS